MTRYIELMEKGWRIEDPSERLTFMEMIPTLARALSQRLYENGPFSYPLALRTLTKNEHEGDNKNHVSDASFDF